jgi:sigma-B regulation protein RsbU (phosphoserine phosphatase)
MTSDAPKGDPLPESVVFTLEEFRGRLGVDLHLWQTLPDGCRAHVFPAGGSTPGPADPSTSVRRSLAPRGGPPLDLEIRNADGDRTEALAEALGATLERTYEAAQEIRFFTYEVSERYEEINLLYSISETLGSILDLEEAARNILTEVSDVLGARRGSLWVHAPEAHELRLIAWVGERGLQGPLPVDDARAVTTRVFREGRSLIVAADTPAGDERGEEAAELGPEQAGPESVLSVPIRYTAPSGSAKTVGVLNLIGRRRGGRFTASDQKLLSAIASQVGAALENNRLIQESLAQERVSREMELAHDLQMKLMPPLDRADGIRVAGRVEPAVSVGGDFYHLFELEGGRLGLMIGDVSGHGFPAALIMALSLSAASIYASSSETPCRVLRQMDDALRDELESTETYLTAFYGILDPESGTLSYSNAGHPHAFVIHEDGTVDRLAATDPPIGIAGPDSYHQCAVPWAGDEDCLFLFTDGLSDTLAAATSGSGEDFVVDQVVRRRRAAPTQIVDELLAMARQATPTVPADDRTAIVLKS